MAHHSDPAPVFERMAEITVHLEAAEDALHDWRRGDVTVDAATTEFYALARAAFAAARQLRADDAVVTTEGDLFDEPEFQAEHGAHVVDPFATERAQITALPEVNDS